MPQPKKGYSLGSNPSHQRLMLSNLASSLFQHEHIKTTEAKAKLLRPYAERIITKAKKGSVHDRRQVLALIEDRDVVHKLFSEIGPRFGARNGGYTRILKLGPRNGDGAPMALIELVDSAAVTTPDETETEASSRRKLGRGRRRRGPSDLPQDKPARSKAADAAAAGTGGADVEPPVEITEEQAEAEQQAEEASAEASTEAAADPAATSGPDVAQDIGSGKGAAGESNEGSDPTQS